MLTVEFHCHTIYSKDSLVRPEALVAAARKKGLDRVIVTDHNSIGGALAAHRLAPDLIIVGEEIKTTEGEFLAAFVKEEIPRDLSPMETLRRLKEQNAFISVSHPFDRMRGWKFEALMQIIPYVDAIETFNARCISDAPNQKAVDFAREHNLAGTVGSDAHTTRELGRAVLHLDSFSTSDDLRRVIRQGRPRTRLSHPLIHATSRFAVTVKKMGLVKRPEEQK